MEQVVVDVVVLDKDGAAVTGLGRGDFVLEEDGVVQSVATFDATAVPADGAKRLTGGEPAARLAAPVATTTSGAQQPGARVLAIVFDDRGLTRAQAQRAVSALRELVLTSTSGDDRVLLFTSSGKERWAARSADERDDVLAVLGRLEGQYVPDTSVERITDSEAYLIEVQRDSRALESVNNRYLLLPAYALTSGRAGDPRGTALRDVQANAAAVYDKARRRVEALLAELERAAAALDGVPGRKQIVLASPGFFFDSTSPSYRRIFEACRRANAAVHFLDLAGIDAMPFGLTSAFPQPFALPQAGVALSESQTNIAEIMSGHFREAGDARAGAMVLANETGGIVATDMELGVRRLREESRAAYLLGYIPSNAVADGKYRKIRVRLASADGERTRWTIRARKGYFAPDTRVDAKAATVDPERELAAALESPLPRTEVPLALSAYLQEDVTDPPGRVRCRVVAEVDVHALAFVAHAERSVASLDAAFADLPRDAPQAAQSLRKHTDLKLSEDTRDRLLRQGYRVEQELRLAPGVHQLRAAVRDARSGRVGSVAVRLEVPGPGAFRVSTPLLSNAFDTDKDGFRHPVPTARREFTEGSNVYLAFDVFGAALDKDRSQPAVSMGYRVLDGAGKAALEVAPQPIVPTARGRLHRFVGFELANVNPGEYRVVGQIEDQVARRRLAFMAPFRVVPPAAESAAARTPAEPTLPAPKIADPVLAALLQRAGAYVVEYEKAFGDLVLEEEYRQRAPGETGEQVQRITRADLVFARVTGAIPWESFRDVFELNGRPVRDRDARLERLFREQRASAAEQAAAILAESARFNIGPERTINMPALPLMFLHPRLAPRFAFERRGKPDGETVEVAFREIGRPTLIRDRPLERTQDKGRDLPAEGRFWLDPKRGTVVRSETRFRWRPFADVATISTTYRADPRLGLWVPVEMRERYEGDRVFRGITEAVAVYSNYRRFGVNVREDAFRPATEPAPRE